MSHTTLQNLPYLSAPLNKHDVKSPGIPWYLPNLSMMKYGNTFKKIKQMHEKEKNKQNSNKYD